MAYVVKEAKVLRAMQKVSILLLLLLLLLLLFLRVEAGWNTSTLVLRVAEDDGKGTQCLGV
jgi:hypothetical protein